MQFFSVPKVMSSGCFLSNQPRCPHSLLLGYSTKSTGIRMKLIVIVETVFQDKTTV